MEVVHNHKYNKALRYWTLEQCGIRTRGDEIYHMCNRHEFKKSREKVSI